MAFSVAQQVTPTQLTQAGQNSLAGPLTDLEAPDFNYNIYSYPIVSNPDYPDQGHNIVFYINIPQLSNWNVGPQNGPGPVVNRGNINATQFGLRTPAQVQENTGNLQGFTESAVNYVLSSKTVRTTTAIALYIPNTMIWSQHAQYENVSISNALGSVGDIGSALGLLEAGHYGAAGAAISSIIPDITKKLGKIAGLGGGLGGGIRNLSLAAAGIADNPQNFLLFKQMDFRKFQFEFILTPETPQEASIINQIVYLFRFHHAPEVLSGSTGRFFIPPSEFDIDIIHNGNRNVNIPRISTCVLNGVNVDYAAAGQWGATYDGEPQQIRLTLDFSEKEILTKDRIQEGF